MMTHAEWTKYLAEAERHSAWLNDRSERRAALKARLYRDGIPDAKERIAAFDRETLELRRRLDI